MFKGNRNENKQAKEDWKRQPKVYEKKTTEP